jgi:hypothetical protein
MIVDAFLANDELDLASFRIRYLAPVVGKFYIAESTQTFQGRSKPLNFAANKAVLESLGPEIEIVEIPPLEDSGPHIDAWSREHHQRYWFLDYVAKLHQEDPIVFTDIDEVPSHEQVVRAQKDLGAEDIRTIPLQFCFRYANWLLEPVGQKYQPGVVLRGTAARPYIRTKPFPPIDGEKGAHLSYVGFAAEQLKEKFSSFSHTELDLEHLYQDTVLDFANEWGIDHIGRPGQPGFGLLRGATSAQLNSVLQSAIDMYPEWHRDFPTKSLVRRLVASSALSSFRSTGKSDYLEDPRQRLLSWRFLRHLAHIFVHTAIRVTRTGTLIKRLQGSR